MGKKLKNVKHYKLRFIYIFIVLLFILLGSFFYIKYVKELTYESIYTSITEIGRQNAGKLNLKINSQMKFVDQIVHAIDNGNFESVEDIFKSFGSDYKSHNFTRLAILDKNGNGITSDNIEIQNYPNIKEFFSQSNVYLSENRPSTVSENYVNIYSKTFKFKNTDLVLFATINTEEYEEILSQKVFSGKGGTLLLNNKGHVLIDSYGLTDNSNNNNFFDYLVNKYNIEDSEILSKITIMKDKILKNEVGNLNLKLSDTLYFLNYEKLGINDWYVITIAPDSVIAKETTKFLVLSFAICVAFCFVIISVLIYIDVSNQIQKHKLYNIAYIDPVTLLGNEVYFKEKGEKFLQNFKKNNYIIALDINKFKALNNIYGYKFCNKILKTLGEKLESILPDNNITCRMSNDIFATVFNYERDINRLLNQIFNEISNFTVDNKKIQVNLSIGVYKIIPEENDINKLLDKAYMARAKVKGVYDINYYIFDEILENKLVEEQKIESSMESALKNKEFKVVYQPKMYVKNEKLYGAEALVRWYKDGEMISPGKFIPLFEKNKFIMKLDLYIFEQVCKDMSLWKEKYNFVPTISINVSKEHFANENFIDEYAKIVDKHKIERGKIDIEITESATTEEKVDTLKLLNSIKEKGFLVSIDDFGTGYSSLSMLQNMPIDIIKIDKIFVDKADLNSDNNIINYIMFIAKHLGVKTIVEGVETKEQVEFIKKIKSDIIQGYYYSKPISKEEFEIYFNEHK